MSEAKKGKNHPFLGKTHSEESRAKMSACARSRSEETKGKMSAALGTPIKVMDIETNETKTYSSIRKAAEALGVTHNALSYHFKNTSCFCFKGRYQIKYEE